MKTGNKAIIGSVIFMLLCVVGLIFSDSRSMWKSFYFVREHLFIIGLILLVLDHVYDTFQLLLLYGLVIYKVELIFFNVFLAFVDAEKWIHLTNSYDITIWLTISIWFILFLCLLIKRL